MRYLGHICSLTLFCVAALSLASSCDKAVQSAGFDVDKENITVGAEGGEDVVRISSSSEWVALASEPWISISPANGVGIVDCSIRIDSTLANGSRSASVRFSAEGETPKTLKVLQTGYGKMIVPEFTEKEIPSTALYDERHFYVNVTTNVEFDVEVETEDGSNVWVSASQYNVKLDRGARPRTVRLEMKWKMNPDPEVRTAKVRFVPSDPTVTLEKDAVLAVTQKAAPKIEDNRAGDSLALVTISEKIQGFGWDTGENMMNWSEVELWSEGDEGLPAPEAVGRVRAVRFFVFSTKESIPQEIRHLKYAETISFYGNTNTMYLEIPLGSEICSLRHLKNLQIAAYGIVSLPDELKDMKQLEVLDLNSNNFSEIPKILTPENFPNLKELNFSGQRRWLTTDLRNKANSRYESGIGLNLNMENEDDASALKTLLRWDKLEYLAFTYSYLEGPIPDFKIGEDGVEGYTEEDAVQMGLRDTIRFLYDSSMPAPAGAPKGTTIPKILPNAKSLRINLNFMTGKLPDWILYHPHFMDWIPETFIFSQQDRGIDSKGNVVGFSNQPKDFEYYYAAYPYYRQKYYISEEENTEED